MGLSRFGIRRTEATGKKGGFQRRRPAPVGLTCVSLRLSVRRGGHIDRIEARVVPAQAALEPKAALDR